MRLFVLSDLHIQGSGDPLYRSFLKLLRERPGAGDTVVLAGDVFDLFVGNKRIFIQRYSEFISVLKGLGEKGVRLHYIEGNHDFLIRRAFSGIRGLQIHPSEVKLEFEGKNFYFAHGDCVDASDYGYKFLRAFFRSPFMKTFVAVAPDHWIEWIGQTSAERSRVKNPRLVNQLTLGRMESLRKLYRSFAAERLCEGYDYVVLGHCHDLDEMEFNIGSRQGQYINVGYPRVHGSYLSWSPGERRIQREALPG